MRAGSFALAAVLLCGCPQSEPQAPPEATAPAATASETIADRGPPPNIVLVLADDLGYGDIAVYDPASKIPTPHIDRLAREGVRLLDAHSPTSICTPSRYGVLTGREPWRESRVRNSLQPLSPPALDDETVTLPELLADAGYTTALVGKWHLGRRYTLRRGNQNVLYNIDWSGPLLDGPLQHGFERFFGLARPGWTFMEDGVALVPPSEEYDLGEVPEPIYGKRAGKGIRAPGFEFEHVLPRYTEWTVAFVEEAAASGRPFFVEFAPAVPHTPIAPSSAFRGKTGVGAYGDVVHELDDSVGRILDALERSGVASETLVVFTSDNGPETHAYERLRETGHASMGPLRGAKHSMFEGGHRVPFIARWPGRIPTGTTSNETVSLVDLMATFASAASIPLPDGAAEDSHDVLPALLGEPATAPIREATFTSRGHRVAIRQGPYILLDMGGGGRPEPRWFLEQRGIVPGKPGVTLFDLENDPGQTRNLASELPEQVERLRAASKRALAAERTAPRQP
jgi:arylsulfatase A